MPAAPGRGDLPIIIVSARADTTDMIDGLEAGADDYVIKPLVASELAARIRALLRRRQPADPQGGRQVLHVGEVEVLADEEVVRRSGREVHLTKTEFRLLVELAAAAGRVVTREELLQRVWGYDYFGDTRLLDVHVRRLRRKIEHDPDAPECVLTVRGSGYKAGVSPYGPTRRKVKPMVRLSLRWRVAVAFGLCSLLVTGALAVVTWQLASDYMLRQRELSARRR